MPLPALPRPRAVVAVLACAALLGACSVPRLVYQQADWLLLRQVDGYLDLDSAQSDLLAAALAARLERHRTGQLPEIAAALRDAAARVRRGLVEADARWAIERGRALLARSAEEFLPPLAEALAAASARQRAHLAARLAERNQEFRDTRALDRPREERFERRARRTVERIEDWTGPLTPEQVELVYAIRNAMPDSAPAWLAYTESRQRALLELLERGAPAPRVEAFLRGWWLELEQMPPDLARKRDLQVDALAQMMVRLDAALNSTQRIHLIGRLEDLARDAQMLAAGT